MARNTTATVTDSTITEEAVLATVQAELITTNEQVKRAGTYELTIKAIKAGMASDARKLKTLDSARAALLDVRVNIIRDTAHAMTFPESHAKAGKTANQPSQSVIAESLGMNRLSFAPYFKAAEHLFELFPNVATEPGTAITDDEREHVASFWKAEALRAKARRDAAKAKADAPKNGEVTTIPGEESEGEGGTGAGAGAGTDGRTADVTVDTVMAAMAVLARTLETFTAEQGFTVEQGMELSEMLDTASALVHASTAS